MSKKAESFYNKASKKVSMKVTTFRKASLAPELIS